MSAAAEDLRDVVQIGQGRRKVAVVHGWLAGAASWAPLWPHLDQERFTYAFVDLPGYGARRTTTNRCTVADASADVLASIHRLGWGRFTLVGHSMGGLIAQLAMVHAQDRVDGLVGICPVPASGSPLGEREVDFRRAVHDLAARAELVAASTGRRHPVGWSQEMAAASFATTSPAALEDYLTSWTTADIVEQVRGTGSSVCVLVGEHDPAYPLSRVRQTWGSHYPNLEVSVVPDAGHYPMSENPGELAAQVEGFLSRCATVDDVDRRTGS